MCSTGLDFFVIVIVYFPFSTHYLLFLEEVILNFAYIESENYSFALFSNKLYSSVQCFMRKEQMRQHTLVCVSWRASRKLLWLISAMRLKRQ